MNQEMAVAVATCADLGAALGGVLGGLSNMEIQAMLDTYSEALATRSMVASDYAPCDEKTAAMTALDALIATFAGGGN